MSHFDKQSIIQFLDQSPTAFHACESIKNNLLKQGFIELDEHQNWDIKASHKYLVTRNDSSIIAFKVGSMSPSKTGFRMLGAHTDSPCLKLKPNPDKKAHGYFQCGVEPYGGVLLNPWFDRELSLAGKVVFQDKAGTHHSMLIDFEQPIAIIPSLAIHLDREANNTRSINPQLHLPVIIGGASIDTDFGQLIIDLIKNKYNQPQIQSILSSELFFYNAQGGNSIGLNQELLVSARLDNLLSCYAGMSALMNDRSDQSVLLVCNDHEEVGSQSYCGAQGPFLNDVLRRIEPSELDFQQLIRHSFLISADNAHAIHPNYAQKHDPDHAPVLGGGVVIKHNANQRYATNANSAALIRSIALKNHIPLQDMVVRSDMACGSTIGPITSANTGIQTCDLGAPQLAMHSIRELAHFDDIAALEALILAFYSH